MKDKKEDLIPINVRPILKEFMEDQKSPLKRKFGKFIPVSEAIMYYLEGNGEFVKKFDTYCQDRDK